MYCLDPHHLNYLIYLVIPKIVLSVDCLFFIGESFNLPKHLSSKPSIK